MPGAGQLYAENKKRGLLFSAATIATGVLLNQTYSTYNAENNLVDQYKLDYTNAVDPAEIDTKFGIYQNQVNTVNDLQNQLIIYGAALGVTWMVNLVDALFFHGLPSD